MKHQERKRRDAYARRYGELVADNVAMEQRIHRLVRDSNRLLEKLCKLEDKHKEVVTELEKAKAAHEELSKGYTDICNANIAQGREADSLRKELTKFQSENAAPLSTCLKKKVSLSTRTPNVLTTWWRLKNHSARNLPKR